MKKIILSVLTIGLMTVGAFAQRDANNLTKMSTKVNANVAKATTIYPESFNDCATIDGATYYVSNQSMAYIISGTNYWADRGWAQRYSLNNVQVKGVAAVLASANFVGGTACSAKLFAASASGIGNELASVSFNTADIADLVNGDDFTLYEFNFASSQSVSNFAVGVIGPDWSDDGSNITCDLLIVGSTEMDCASENGELAYYLNDDEGGWVDYISGWGGNVVFDLYLFPIIEGTNGLTDVELNNLTYVYPNPANDEMIFASSYTINTIEIYNVL
ncbi:MAG: T9SS type A sorting domain-containing protein, partial [Bacteroidales bacterium]|nr:T9SS type A sorting domain-containing protein [Bacteroidales bacterium]